MEGSDLKELDERVLESTPLILGMAVFFGAAFALVFGLIALVMEGLFVLSEQAIMAGLAAFGGFLVVALYARNRMRDERDRLG